LKKLENKILINLRIDIEVFNDGLPNLLSN